MKLNYKNKQISLTCCSSFFSRLKGFMGQKNINHALMFPHCNSIHTFFMKQNIDVILCDQNNNILYFYPNFPKNKIILPKKKVAITYETPPNYFNLELNTKLEVTK